MECMRDVWVSVKSDGVYGDDGVYGKCEYERCMGSEG